MAGQSMGFFKRVFMGFALIVVGVPALFLLWAFLNEVGANRHSWHQKMTVTVVTPQGSVSGSSVSKASVSFPPPVEWFPGMGNAQSGLKGEAVVVDLAEGKHLFALLRSANSVDYMQHIAKKVFAEVSGLERDVSVLERDEAKFYKAMKAYREAMSVPPDHYPLLVTFNDITDPSSVVEVDPYDLDAAFGLCADGSGLRDGDAPWRAAGMKSLRWQAWQASGLSREEFDKQYSAGVPFGQRVMESITPRDTSNDCHRLQPITIAITSEPRTKGKVEKVFGWIVKAQFIIPPSNQPRYVKDQTTEQKLMPSDFIDWKSLSVSSKRK